MQTIETTNLEFINQGKECRVYRLDSKRVVKCYFDDHIRFNNPVEKVREASMILASMGLGPKVGPMIRWTDGYGNNGLGFICDYAISFSGEEAYPKEMRNVCWQFQMATGINLSDMYYDNIGYYDDRVVILDVGRNATEIVQSHLDGTCLMGV